VREELPRGTVTFLFTDVEGSTRLLHELGAEGYAQALAEHRRVIRGACTAQGGVEVDTQGDAFFFAFPTAPGALAAAEAFTQELAFGPIRVRVGLHAGTPLVTDEGYVGDDVHFAARVAASAHGGQVVVSQATRDAVGADHSLTDLGEHRLKDIAEAVSIHQLGDGAFPPLKTISNTNLPQPASSFVGRERELEEVLARIDGGARLLTLTGPGGSGKTRLALEAAASLVPGYKAGVFWVGLSSLRDPALVTETISQTLGAKDDLADHIGERDMLLLLDNLEQVIDAAPELSALLEACPNLTLLVTSRELLRVQGEVEYPVPPLAPQDAIELFCARSQLESSEDITELCRRLDNLPLAVELAAARTTAVSPAQIVERLSKRLDLLKGGRDADPRQQTLRATIEWSYELLSPEEQRLFARLAVFAGGCTLEAAEEVADADLDTLQALVEKSLVRFTDGRYWMLETIREYAAAQLAGACELDAMFDRVGRFLLDLVESSPAARGAGPGQIEVFERLEAEHANVRTVVENAFVREKYGLVVQLAYREWHFLASRGHGAEADAWFRRALPQAVDVSAGDISLAAAAASEIARELRDFDRSEALKSSVVEAAREGEPEAKRLLASTLAELSDIALARSDVSAAREFAEEALRASLDPGRRTRAISSLASATLAAGDLDKAEELLMEVAEAWKGRHDFNYAVALTFLGEVAERKGDRVEAGRRYRSALRGFADLRVVERAIECFVHLARLDAEAGNVERAGRLLGASSALREKHATIAEAIEVPATIPRPALDVGAAMDFDEAVEYALTSLD